MIVRPATLADTGAIYVLAKHMADETATYALFDFDGVKAIAFIHAHLENPKMMSVVAEADDGQVVGAMLASAKETFFGKDIVTCDDAFYVLPEHRGKGVMAQFLMAYHQWADQFDPIFVYLGVTLGINDERTVNALKQAGYEGFGTLLRRKS